MPGRSRRTRAAAQPWATTAADASASEAKIATIWRRPSSPPPTRPTRSVLMEWTHVCPARARQRARARRPRADMYGRSGHGCAVAGGDSSGCDAPAKGGKERTARLPHSAALRPRPPAPRGLWLCWHWPHTRTGMRTMRGGATAEGLGNGGARLGCRGILSPRICARLSPPGLAPRARFGLTGERGCAHVHNCMDLGE